MVKFRIRSISARSYLSGLSMKKWVFLALAIMAVAVLWIAYFFYSGIRNNGDIRIIGKVVFGSQALINARISMGEMETFTDERGEFALTNSSFGRKKITIAKSQFKDHIITLFTWKKEQSLGVIVMQKDPQYLGVYVGLVVNNFDKRPIANAMVNLDGEIRYTNDQGAFIFEQASLGEVALKISAVGYFDFEEKVKVIKDGQQQKEIALSPYGRFSFTSTREGKKSIYSVNYDGTGIKNITGKYAGESWGGRFSKDGKRLVFYANIDEENKNEWGQQLPALYSVDGNGEKLTRLTRDGITPVSDFAIANDGTKVVF